MAADALRMLVNFYVTVPEVGIEVLKTAFGSGAWRLDLDLESAVSPVWRAVNVQRC